MAGQLRIVVLSRRDAQGLEDAVSRLINAGFEAPPLGEIRKLLSTASKSSNHLWHFLDGLGKKLDAADSWAVAIKGLTLLHELLRCGSSAIEADLIKMCTDAKERPRSLNLLALANGFVQKPGPASEQRTAMTRTYVLYVLQRLACADTVSLVGWARRTKGTAAQSGSGPVDSAGSTAERDPSGETGQDAANRNATSVTRGFDSQYWQQQATEVILEQTAALQALLGQLVSCRPDDSLTPSRFPFLVLALELVLRDSFDLYSSINYALMELVERFGTMQREQASAALEICRASAQQAEELAVLYHSYGEQGVGQGVAFPTVAVLGESYLRGLEEYMGEDLAREVSGLTPGPSDRSELLARAKSLQLVPHSKGVAGKSQAISPAQAAVKAVADQQFDATWRALFATDRYSARPPAAASTVQSAQHSAMITWQTQSVPPGNRTGVQSRSWETALDATLMRAPGTDQWELALASQRTPLLFPQPVLLNGFDELLLDSLYDAAQAQRRAYGHMGTGGSYPQSGSDPFAASVKIEPPAYVQMAIRAQQQMAMLLQQHMMAKHAYYASIMRGGTGAPRGPVQPENPYGNCRNPDNVGVSYGNVLVPYS